MTVNLEFNEKPSHIFFGGTFDPPHEGHRLVINLCLESFGQSKVVVIPAGHPAGSFDEHKTVDTSFEDRVQLCQKAFADEITRGRVIVETLEQKLPAPNYSWKTLEELEKKYPGSRWAILLGFDQLQNFDGWKNSDLLVKKYGLIAVERPGFDSLDAIIPKLSESFGDLTPVQNDVYQMESGRYLFAVTGRVSEAQSRVIRTSPEDALAKGWIKPKVLEYIRKQKLYGEK